MIIKKIIYLLFILSITVISTKYNYAENTSFIIDKNNNNYTFNSKPTYTLEQLYTMPQEEEVLNVINKVANSNNNYFKCIQLPKAATNSNFGPEEYAKLVENCNNQYPDINNQVVGLASCYINVPEMFIPYIMKNYATSDQLKEKTRYTSNLFCNNLAIKLWSKLSDRQKVGFQQISMISTYLAIQYYYDNQDSLNKLITTK
ncbi:hypothetical protein ACFX5K_01685 [Rickettsiales bacterium LUAb2]